MSDNNNKEEDTSKQEQQKDLNFSIQDILENNHQNAFSVAQPTFRNQNTHSVSYNNLPAEIQHLFDMPSADNNYPSNQWSGRSSPLTRVQSNPTPQSSPQTSPMTTHSSPIMATAPSSSVHSSPSQQPIPIAPQQTQQVQPAQPASADNLTAQLSSDRKERFIELFRQLQSNSVTANQFLAQAKQLLDQQQYQQLENLKSKPVQRPSPNRPSPHIPHKTISSSQLRAEDAQRAMSGLIRTPQAKRTRASDIPAQPLPPLYRSNTAPQSPQSVQQQMKQHLMQQQPMQSLPVQPHINQNNFDQSP
ncbi:uncharacterized protein B0P05DRAFT_572950 [Gilbertella persicaria]|uniref:uncharacterized protein n=1 Tax=Gilbertella persicaria TaxID=101096 RepID=UPI00221FAFED|nr:uncharacterized protein B0P05DRAFT_572950 [Gilbertella persicaria]KAI8073395.1 hypothetical protein B0P05DRAFT_572950 [Gilbertella persicaria]